jgi:hypothetical protein
MNPFLAVSDQYPTQRVATRYCGSPGGTWPGLFSWRGAPGAQAPSGQSLSISPHPGRSVRTEAAS